MTEFRSRILQSKQNESSLIATSRKRKLRELFAIADCDGPIPLSWVLVDAENPQAAPAPTDAEAQFLEHNDIRQRRVLDESSIPQRRQLRSYIAKAILNGLKSIDSQTPDTPRLSSKALREDGIRKTRDTTPGKESATNLANSISNATDTLRRGRSAASFSDAANTKARRPSSKSSQIDLLPGTGAVIDTIVDETIAQAIESAPSVKDDVLQDGVLEKEHITSEVESQPGSPGVDPRKAIPISAEDAAQLSEPIINGVQDELHKPATVHLPPKNVQEERVYQNDRLSTERDSEERKENKMEGLSLKLPVPHCSRALGDAISSPSSTIGVNSATTPALHEASTDTSPDNEASRYNNDVTEEKDADPQTPPELTPTKEEVLEKEEHDRLLNAQMEIARSEILASSPASADAQLRLEDEQAAAASLSNHDREIADSDNAETESSQDVTMAESPSSLPDSRRSTISAVDAALDVMDEEDDEVVGVPTPEDEKAPVPEETSKPDSTAAVNSSVKPMILESITVQNEGATEPLKNGIVSEPKVEKSQSTVQSSEKAIVARNDMSPITTSVSSPCQVPSGSAPVPPTVERMTTRVASGAMRHKSVSEILGEIPRPNTTSTPERASTTKRLAEADSAPDSNSQSRSSTPQSSQSQYTRMRSLIERAKEKERTKLSTVVFAKQPSDRTSKASGLVPSGTRSQGQESADYFMPLILSQAYNSTRGIQPLENLLLSAHKTVTTSNAYVPFHEYQSHKVVRRIHNLQTQDKWSLRQPKRSPEPNRPTTHWDELLKEAEWMRTDFREERKWKMAVARNLAKACAEWVEADAEDRKLLQVPASLATKESRGKGTDDGLHPFVDSSNRELNHSTPELVASGAIDSPTDEFDEEPRASLLESVAPSAIFVLSDDDVVFSLRRSPATDKLLEELPMYGSPLKVPQSDLPTSEVDPDASWKRPALPLSKYAEGKIVLKQPSPPRKRSRYDYEVEDEDDEVVFGEPAMKRVHLQPELLDVALFNPENKHIRDRIHAGHQFRPPSENPMPLQSFFECRSPSQWTWAEDDELKGLVREYSYNWQLISSMMSSRSLFTSSAERRTPWECFERWIHLEGLPADMQKTHYFRAYNNRLEAAQRTVQAQVAQQQPQVNAAGAAVTPIRRRNTTSIRVERRRNQKHLTLVDAMRKLAKKRETSLQKQQHAAGLAAMRKANEIVPPPGTRHTPQDFSRLKHERELQLLERMQRHQMQQEAARRQALQGRAGQQQNPQQYPNGGQPPRNPANINAVPSVNIPPNANRPNQLAVSGQNLPHSHMQSMSNGMGQVPMTNGHGPVAQMLLKGVPQAPMQGMPGMPGLPGQHRMPAPNPPPDLRLVMQARQISEQQRQAVQMQQHHSQGQNTQIHNSPPNMRANLNGMNQAAFMQNNQANMMAGFNPGSINGVSTPPANGLNVPPVGPAGSPRMGHPSQPQQPNGSLTQINKLEAQFRAQFPTASPEQINKLVRDALSQNLAAQRQSAMHAAAGNPTGLAGMQNSPQQYAQMLRAQQERQAAVANQQPRTASAGSGSGIGK